MVTGDRNALFRFATTDGGELLELGGEFFVGGRGEPGCFGLDVRRGVSAPGG